MRTRAGAGLGTLGVGVMIVAGVTGLGAAAAVAQTATPSASHDVVMRMSVPASCRMSAVASQIRLTGASDDGVVIDTTLSGQGGLTVDCNTPYAMTLARTPVYEALPRRTLAQAPAARIARATTQAPAPIGSLAHVIEDDATPRLGDEMNVLVRVDGRGGALESTCVLAKAGNDPFICHAFSGPDDGRVPPPRAAASLLVTGAIERPGQQPAFYEDEVPATDAPTEAQRAVMVADDAREKASVRRARAPGRRIGDRLTVSLTAKY